MAQQVPGTEYAKWLRKKAAEYTSEAEKIKQQGGVGWGVLYGEYMKNAARELNLANDCEGNICLVDDHDPFWKETRQE